MPVIYEARLNGHWQAPEYLTRQRAARFFAENVDGNLTFHHGGPGNTGFDDIVDVPEGTTYVVQHHDGDRPVGVILTRRASVAEVNRFAPELRAEAGLD